MNTSPLDYFWQTVTRPLARIYTRLVSPLYCIPMCGVVGRCNLRFSKTMVLTFFRENLLNRAAGLRKQPEDRHFSDFIRSRRTGRSKKTIRRADFFAAE
ncbi:hypothetical protein KJ940_02910, partial [Myxococcota bacterium]|nr:hypothetical protein [Myxococcota bacterium]